MAAVSIGVAVFVLTRGQDMRAAAVEGFETSQESAGDAVQSASYTALSGSRDEIQRLADEIAASEASDTDAQAKRSAIVAAHSFLLDRFGSIGEAAGQDAYRAFARRAIAQGASLKTDLAFNTPFARYYESMTGTPPPPDGDPVELFATLAAAEDARSGGMSVPTGIAISRGSVAVALGRYSLANPGWPLPSGPTNDAIMYTAATTTHRPVWSRSDDLAAQMASGGSAAVAQVHFFLQFGAGDRRPCLINLVWSPERSEWLVASTGVGAPSMDAAEFVRWAY
jgi:hypothetical protein